MKHFVKLNEDLMVEESIVISNELAEGGPEAVKTALNLAGTWMVTDPNSSIPGTVAGIGYTYDKKAKKYIPPQVFPSWILNKKTYQWEAPIPRPEDGSHYYWDEDEGDWIEFVYPTVEEPEEL